MIDEGTPFPPFSLSDQDGNIRTLDALKGSPAIIYFYPKDDTPGCTVEACEFRDIFHAIPGVHLLGVSPDNVKSHRKFTEKFGLNYPLLADTDHALASELGIWVEKSMYGKKYMGIERTTYILDRNGIVVKVFRKVTPAGHSAEVRAALEDIPK